ncbi:hypothetical protein BV22DRAFT_809476 [Leucogyrophana mollusca]|uniref:Uncharacterized protein n=1 Tax=Leucogyrophana mollusca TaxID=85980 RepID=A0ACB8B3R8_9AGAM|nr:hypothetical protein BV22DRAFT_809476 [Leucogyrophana mollusca]
MPIPRPIEHADTTARDNPGADNPRQVPDPSWQAPAMIVPASSFYDPEHALQQPPADYQPWLDALDASQPYQAPQEYGGDHQYQQPQMQYQFVQQPQGQMYQQPHLAQSTSSLVSQQRQILPQPRRSHNRSAATAGPYYRTPQSQQQPSAQQVQQQRTSELIGESFDPQHQYAVDVQHQSGVTTQHQQSSGVQHPPGVAVQHQSGGAQHHQGGSAHHPEGGSDQRQLGSSAQHQQGITSQHQSVSAQHQPGVAGHSQGVRQSRQYARQRHVSQPHAQVTREQYSSSTQTDRYPSAAQADQYSPAAQVGQYATGAQQEQYASTVQQDQYVSSAQQDQYTSSAQGDPYASTAQQDQYASGTAHQDRHYAHAQQPESAPYYFQTQAQAQQQHLLSAVPETGLYHLGRASQSQPALVSFGCLVLCLCFCSCYGRLLVFFLCKGYASCVISFRFARFPVIPPSLRAPCHIFTCLHFLHCGRFPVAGGTLSSPRWYTLNVSLVAVWRSFGGRSWAVPARW